MSKTLKERVSVLEVKVEEGFNQVSDAIYELKTNDFHELRKELVGLKACSIKNSTNTAWLMKSYWVIAGASVGGLITQLITAIL